MKNFYYIALFFAFSLCITAQTAPTGNSAEVGITEGELSVSLTGGATYSIPIAVPPGINGVVPQISLAYNSQGGNGMAGYGWNISGVSVITRIPATKFHNNNFGTIKYNLSDNYALDGQRLIVKNGGEYGADGTVYETENFSNIKITSIGSLSSVTNIGPDYFIVEYPDGSKAYYGNINANNSHSRSQNEYAITYWENPQRVRISYYYTSEVFKKLILNSIKYGSINSYTSMNEIQFIYKNRVNPEVQYISGLGKTDDKILSEIKVLGNDTGFRNYVLNHDNSSLGYERLTQFTEKSGDGTASLNPTNFSYVENQTNNSQLVNWSGSSSIPSKSSINEIITGDYDGDGEIDFVTKDLDKGISMYKMLDDNSVSNLSVQSSTYFTGENKYNKLFSINSLDKEFKISNRQNICTIKSISINEVQFNVFKYNTTNNSIELDYNKVFTSLNLGASTANSYAKNYGYFDGDFNGDYLTDIIFIANEADGLKIKFFDLDRRNTNNLTTDAGTIVVGTTTFTLTPNVSNGLATITGSSIIKTGDVNGDGKTDLILFRGSPYNDFKVYSLEDNKFVPIISWTHDMPGDVGSDFYQSMSVYNNTVVGSGSQRFPIVIGDYNGDGKSDILFVAIRKVLISTGIAFIEETLPSSFLPPAYPFKEQILTVDFNNDGKTDILRINDILTPHRNGTYNGQPWYDNDYGIKIDYYHRSGNSTNPWQNYNFERILVPYQRQNDTNTLDDNHFDKLMIPLFVRKNKVNPAISELAIIGQIGKSYDPVISFFSCNNFLPDQNLIKDITSGNGVRETITYSPLKNGNGVYSSDLNIEAYPNFSIENNLGFKVVSKIEKQSASVYKKQLFSYYGGVTNLEGLGFLGFRGMSKTNWHQNDSQIITSISKNDITLRGANTENYSVLGYTSPNYIPDTFITKSVLTYESELLPNKVFKIRNTISKQYNTLENTGSETTTVYDAYNNPTQSTTLIKEGETTVQTTVSTVAYDNQPAGSTYYIGRPTNKKQSVAVNGDTMTTEEQYEYTNHLLTQIKKKGTNTDFITEDNLYDPYGNIAKKIITATGLKPRITNYEYDSSGRFLTKSSDIESLTTTFDYNKNNGLLNFETNPYGLTTYYKYDPWFKKIKTTDYLGNSNTYTYTRNEKVNTLVTTTGDDGSSSQQLFDDLGRKTTTRVKNITGAMSNIDYHYDIYDKNIKVSEPYDSSPSQFNTTEYDVYGRIIKSTSFTGKIVNINYSGLTTTVNDGSKTKTYTKNAVGNVVTMTDSPGGTVNYTYFANGNLKSSNYDGVTITIEQDGWGRKTKLTDSSAGTYTYAYNGLGETTSETTPNGTTTYELDDFGKLKTKTISGTNTNSATDYVYDGSSKLLLSSTFKDLKENTQINYSYTYDDSKRIVNTLESNPSYGTSFTKAVSYDAFGRIEYETTTAALAGKSSAKKIKNTYKNGAAFQIIDAATQHVLWQTNTVNARGQLTGASLGNDITIANTYDQYGFAAQFKHDRTGGNPANIMTLNTAFDAQKGNLTNRTNSLFNRNENFVYDAQDRLTEFTNAQEVQEKQSYDDKGRITQNNLGTYSYTKTDKPYQSTSVIVTPDALTYYTAKPVQNITYNTFKSPVEIDEKDVDKISFSYNDNNSRTAMFYGSLDNDKMLRPYRKYYSADGTMEIKYNKNTSATAFITYIGGDGYTAPIAVKSDGVTQNYLYLQRDYQGSILAITDEAGVVLEKRQFDAWGSLTKTQDGAGNTLAGLIVLDRGYTGHEHLQSMGLINMNGRVYDPKLHRFLQPDNNIQDPFNTQNYNRYSYVLNNPLKYTDPSGEFWEVLFGTLFSAYVHGASANGGELNPAKWNATGWKNAGLAVGSFGASTITTNLTNNYVDNYNKPPELGVSAKVESNGGEKNHPYVSTSFSDMQNPIYLGYNNLKTNDMTTSSLIFERVKENNIISTGKGVNDYVGLVATGLEVAPGSFRLSTTMRGFSPKFYSSGWTGNQFATTYGLSKLGKNLGTSGAIVGLALDAQGVRNYYNPKYGPNSPNSVNPGKAALNTGMSAYGLLINPIAPLLYSGIDMFYPGGWTGDDKNPGLAKDLDRLNQENKAINPNWQLWPGAMKQ